MKHKHTASLSLLLAAALALSLTACGSGGPDASGSVSGGSGSGSLSEVRISPAPDDAVPDRASVQPAPAPAPDPSAESLARLRMDMEPSAAIAGVFFMGSHESDPLDDAFFAAEKRQDFWKKYPFMKEIPVERCAQAAGWEVYCIIPADPSSSVRVTEWDESGDRPVEGRVLYESSSGEPFLVQGNVSDIMPNLSVTVTDSYGNVLENFHPRLSNADGTVDVRTDDDQPVVLDLTPYPMF